MINNIEIPWNFITRDIPRAEFIEEQIHERISRLAQHLGGFPEGSVHLHIELDRSAKQDGYSARVMLRVPTDIIQSEKSSDDLMKALDLAVASVIHDLEACKATLAGSRHWRNREFYDPSKYPKSAAFALQAQAEGTGPQSDEDVVRELLRQHRRELLHHIREDIRHAEEAEEIPPNTIDAHDVLDVVEKRAMAKADEGSGMTWMVWFDYLIHDELKRRLYVLKNEQTPASQPVVARPPSADDRSRLPRPPASLHPIRWTKS